MDLVSVLFVICWLFSLALFFLVGFAASGILAARAKKQMIESGKEAVFNFIEKVKDNGHSKRIHDGESNNTKEDEPEHLGDWGDYGRNVTDSDPEDVEGQAEQEQN